MEPVDHSMRDLWRRMTLLLWRYPILWLPVLIADAAGQCLTRLDNFLAHRITRAVIRLATSHSVLGPPYYTHHASNMSLLVSGILRASLYWGAQYLTLALYTVALLAIASLLQSLAEERPPRIRQALVSALSHRRSIAIFALKLLGLVLAGGVILFAIGVTATLQPHRYMIATMPNVMLSIIAVLECIVAWIIIPATLRLLRPGSPERPSRDSTRHARLLAIVAVCASAFLAAFLAAIRTDILGTYPISERASAYTAFSSFVLATPYIVLFIAFSLVAVPALSGFATNPHGPPGPSESHPEEGRIEI